MFQIKNQQIFISRFVFLISILSSFAFGIAGITKIIGVEMMHDSFVKMNLPYWFGYFIGVSELAGSIGIQLKKLRKLASLGLSIIMLGAIFYHINYELEGLIAAIILFTFCLILLFSKVSEKRKVEL